MLAAQLDRLETKLAAGLRDLNERAELCQAAGAQGQESASFEAARMESLQRAKVIKDLLESEWIETGRA